MNKFSDFHMNWKRGLKSKLKQAGKKHKYDKCIFIGTGGIKRVGIRTTIIPTFTTTDSPQGESPEFKTLKVFLYCTILAFSSLGNGLVFLLISCNRRLRQGSSNRLLLNLSACDFLTPLLGIPFDLVLEERGYVWPYGEFMCHALWPASTFTATASALTLAAISLDR